jgi:NMD protein affecting ribosome stability and mRNA decay
MALQPCVECGAKISSQASACPQCGAKARRKTSAFTKIAGSLFAIIVAVSVLSPKTEVPPPAPKTPAQQAAEAQKEARFQKTVLVVKTIRSALRDPESVKWESVAANDDASIVCVEYRARNGFGGLNLERATYAKGKLSTESVPWNKNCAHKSLFDMDYVRQAL